MNSYSGHCKSVKVFLCFAVFLLVAKPFLGFSMFSRIHQPSGDNIFVKAFTKRKQEYVEGGNFNIESVQKKLAEPVNQFYYRFIAFLSVLFPLSFAIPPAFTNASIKKQNLTLSLHRTSSIRTGILII